MAVKDIPTASCKIETRSSVSQWRLSSDTNADSRETLRQCDSSPVLTHPGGIAYQATPLRPRRACGSFFTLLNLPDYKLSSDLPSIGARKCSSAPALPAHPVHKSASSPTLRHPANEKRCIIASEAKRNAKSRLCVSSPLLPIRNATWVPFPLPPRVGKPHTLREITAVDPTENLSLRIAHSLTKRSLILRSQEGSYNISLRSIHFQHKGSFRIPVSLELHSEDVHFTNHTSGRPRLYLPKTIFVECSKSEPKQRPLGMNRLPSASSNTLSLVLLCESKTCKSSPFLRRNKVHRWMVTVDKTRQQTARRHF